MPDEPDKSSSAVPSVGKWSEIVRYARSPVSVFIVALLFAVPAFPAVAMSGMSDGYKSLLLVLLIVMILVVVGVFAYITIRYPTHVSEEMAKAIQKTQSIEQFIESQAFQDMIVTIIEKRVKPEALQVLPKRSRRARGTQDEER